MTSEKEKPNSNNKKFSLIGSFCVARVVFIRYVAFIYSVAFAISLQQNASLIGDNGLLPARDFMSHIRQQHRADDGDEGEAGGPAKNMRLFLAIPTLFWFFDLSRVSVDSLVRAASTLGLAISLFVCLLGRANAFMMALAWLLYHSIVNVGQVWYSFGWESQLLELGFLAIFMCPFVSLNLHSIENTLFSFIPFYLNRWFIFRIMLGAGLIKVRGDVCWRDLTCMNYHYETQPVPNPISFYLHKSPEFIHKFETASNHVIELVLPWLLLLPRKAAMIGGAAQIAFQIVLIISGNLSFLNWLTIAPSFCCFDDEFWRIFCSKSTIDRLLLKQQPQQKHQQQQQSPSNCASCYAKCSAVIGRLIQLALLCLIAYRSAPIIANLASNHQIMNTSYDPFRLVNTYGAFGSVTKQRTEVVFQGSHLSVAELFENRRAKSRRYTDTDEEEVRSGIWREYEFKCKPGRVDRRPCLISPYHYRLDWLMWFAAFQSYQENVWLVHLALKMLNNDPVLDDVIQENPFLNSTQINSGSGATRPRNRPPLTVRARHYRYEYAKGAHASAGNWWKRTLIGEYLPEVNLQMLEQIQHQFGWKSYDSVSNDYRSHKVSSGDNERADDNRNVNDEI